MILTQLFILSGQQTMISNLETNTGLMKSSCYLLRIHNHIITHHDWKVINPSDPSNPSLKIPFAERWPIPTKFPLDLLTEELMHIPNIHLQHDLLFGLADGNVYRDTSGGRQRSERFRNTWIELFKDNLASDLKKQIDNPKDDWEEISLLELKTCLLGDAVTRKMYIRKWRLGQNRRRCSSPFPFFSTPSWLGLC